MSTSKFSNFLKNTQKLFKVKFNFQFQFKRNLALDKIAALNFSLLFHYFCFSFFNDRRKKVARNISNKSDFDYLLNLENLNKLEKLKISNKKTPKIIYVSNLTETDDDKIKIKSNFEKIHSKFSDLDSYYFNLKQKVDSFIELEEFLKTFKIDLEEILGVDKNSKLNERLIKEKLSERPFIIINKYADSKSYSLEEFTEISKPDSNFHFLEKLQILNNKNDLLLLNDYDNAFVIYIDNKNVDYSNESFKVFRKMFFLLNFFNIKFFVATREHSEFLNKNDINLEYNNVYLIKRENMLDDDVNDNSKIKYENENFKIFNLTDEILKGKTNEDSKILYQHHLELFFMDLIKILLRKTNFVYYANHSFKKKQGLEIFNLYFKDVPYYLYFTNLKDDKNKTKLKDILQIFRENLNSFQTNFVFVLVDNEKVNSCLICFLEQEKFSFQIVRK